MDEKDRIFRKYIHDLTNNESLTDLICRLNTPTKERHVRPEAPELNDDELFASNLYEAVPSIDLVETICHIRDLIYGDGENHLDVDPEYEDAIVEDEARPKVASLIIYQPEEPVGADTMLQSLREENAMMHIRKFNPMPDFEIQKFRNLPMIEKLKYLPMAKNEYYDRW